MEITLINKETIEKNYTMRDAIEANKDSFALYSKKETDIPLRTNIDIKEHKGQSLYMPGYASEKDALGVKIVSVYPENINKGLPSVPSTMVLLDAETGFVKGLMDGTYLTQIRTGAIAGAATDILARKDASVFTIFGTGGQAESQVEAVLEVREIKEVYVCDLDEKRAQDFADRMQARFDIPFSVSKDPDASVSKSDIITCVTTTPKPLFKYEVLKKGAHINGIGSYTPDMQEIAEDVFLNADGVYCDTKDGVLNEAGDFITPINNKVFDENIIDAELGEIINGDKKGRTSDDEITVFKSTGSAVLDVVNAQKIYEKVTSNQEGQTVNL